MNARTSRSSKADRKSGEGEPAGDESGVALDDLLDARFDEEGHLSPTGRNNRERVVERLDQRPPAMSADDLERAVQKLALGLEAIERQGQAARQPDSRPPAAGARPAAAAETGEKRGRDFVTHSLDRLEARLEALSQRLQQRAAPAAPESSEAPTAVAADRNGGASPQRSEPAASRRGEPSLAVEPRREGDADRLERQRRSEAEAVRVLQLAREAAEQRQRDEDAAAEARRASETAESRHRAEADATRRQLEATLSQRSAEVEAARQKLDAAEARHVREADEARRHAAAAQARQLAEAEKTRKQVEAADARLRQVEAKARDDAAAAAESQRQLAALQDRIDALQQSSDANRIEPVRRELLDLLRQIEQLSRDGRSVTGMVERVQGKLDEIETKLNGTRNLASNRLGEFQERLSGMADRLGAIESEVPGFDAMREGQTAILERFDLMQGLVQRLASPEQILERVDGLKRQLQTIASQREVARVEEHILHLADRLDALPDDLSERPALERIEAQLQAITSDFAAARQLGSAGSVEAREQLVALHASLREVAETGRTPDLSGLEARLSLIADRLVDERRASGDLLARLDMRLADLTDVVQAQEDGTAEKILARLTGRIDGLAEAIGAQDVRGARRDLEGLDRKLDQLNRSVAQQAEQFARPLEPLEERLDRLQSQLNDVAQSTRASSAQFGPFAQKLQEIAERVSAGADTTLVERLEAIEQRLAGLAARGGDSRAVSNQLDNIVSRLELLKGRSIDPARLADIFDRVDAAMRAGNAEAHFERLEQKLDESARAIPAERLERLEQRLAETAKSTFADQRFDRLEQKLEESTRAVPEDRLQRLEQRLAETAKAALADERFDRLELQLQESARALPDERLERLERRIAELAEASLSGERFDRLEQKIDESARALPEERLERLERRIAETARAGLADERFDRLEQKIEASARPAVPDDVLARIEERLGAAAPVPLQDERFSRLEQKIEEIGRFYASSGDVLTPDDMADLRDDIVALRRELRSLPGLGAGEANLGAVLQTISARLEQLPDDPPATVADLDNHIERIAQLIEDPSQGRLALAHIETSLKTIEERLEDARRMLGQRADLAGPSEGDIDTVADIARALSIDVGTLKNSSEISERKTKDALEAVQGTLEAVVKRMAFLERDAEIAASTPAGRTSEASQAVSAAPPAAAPYPIVRPAMAAPRLAMPAAMFELDADKPEPTRESNSGGLLSRFTSSQLLKRATGGRAESFSPDAEESEDSADMPLEPGTDAPLDSALVDAPSSDTALFSGARGRGRGVAAARGADLESAARRAAQAASAEAADSDRTADDLRGAGPFGRFGGLMRRRRRAILASALVIAVAFAAVQILRERIGLGEFSVAGSQAERSAPPRALPPPVPESSPAATPAESGSESREETAASARLGSPADPGTNAATADAGVGPTSGQATGPAIPARPADIAASPAVATADTAAPAPAVGAAAARTGPAEAAPVTAGGPVETAAFERPAAIPDGAAAPGSDTSEQPADIQAGAQPTAPETPAAAVPAAIGLPADLGPEKLRAAAAAGDPVASFEVAARYAEGRGVAENMPEAVAWYRKAADSGLAPAQYRLGSIYEKGLGIPKDLVAAQDWYDRAVQAGNVKAMHNLAVLHAEGAGGPPDLERAAVLFRRAAEHGVRDSQFNLAILHARGLGVPQDMLEAYKWFAVAAGSGDAESLKRRDIIAAALSPDDLAKAEAAAAGFEPVPLIAEANDVAMPEGGWGEEASATDLRDTDDLIELVQKLLAEKGFDPGPPDGMLGRQTVEAITRFQEETGLPRTGQIDTGLVAALQQQSG